MKVRYKGPLPSVFVPGVPGIFERGKEYEVDEKVAKVLLKSNQFEEVKVVGEVRRDSRGDDVRDTSYSK